MRDPKTVPKIPLYLRLSKSLTYLCFSVILFSTSAVTWAQDLEGSIPNENGDYCVITGPPVLPNGGAERLKLFIQSSTDATAADINGERVSLGHSKKFPYDSFTSLDGIQETTLYTLTIVPKVGSEYSCSTLVTVLDKFGTTPKEDSCSLMAIPFWHSNKEIGIDFFLSWEKFKDHAYYGSGHVLTDDKDRFRAEGNLGIQNYSRCGFGSSSCYGLENYYIERYNHQYLNPEDFPVTYTAKVYWRKNYEDDSYEAYDVVSRCSVTVDMLPEKLPPSPQPVQPTKLTYNDGLQAGKQQCIDDPTACGIASSGIKESCMPVIYDAITNVLSIPEVLIPVITGDTQSFDVYEALLSVVPAPDNSLQLKVDKMSQLNKPASDEEPASDEDSWSDHLGAEQAIEVTKLYLTLNNQDNAVSIINTLQNVNLVGEFLNGIVQYSGDPTGQVLFVLEFFLRHSPKYQGKIPVILFSELIQEGTITNAYDNLKAHLDNNATANGYTQNFHIRVVEGWGILNVSDVDVKIHQITEYYYDSNLHTTLDKGEYRLSDSKPSYPGKFIGGAYGYSFGEIKSGLYLAEIREDGELLMNKSVFVDAVHTQTKTINLN